MNQIQYWYILHPKEAFAITKCIPLLNGGLKASNYRVTNFSG